MKARCYVPTNNRYKSYGGKGVVICKRWHDFRNFLKDMGESYKEHCDKYGERNTSIDRINCNDNYTPKNCKWNTLGKQNLNRTNNHLLTYKGETYPIAEWNRIKGFNETLILHRINRGWSVDKIMETPVRKFNFRKK